MKEEVKAENNFKWQIYKGTHHDYQIFLHSMAHLFNWNLGLLETVWENGELITYFVCGKCGRKKL